MRDRVIGTVLTDWDIWRRKHREEGDAEDTSRITRKERKAEELYNAVSEEYSLPEDEKGRETVDTWVGNLSEDARFNFASYAECFISENLVRRLIEERRIVRWTRLSRPRITIS